MPDGIIPDKNCVSRLESRRNDMSKMKSPVPAWKRKGQEPGSGVNLLKPFSKSDFPQSGRKEEDNVLR